MWMILCLNKNVMHYEPSAPTTLQKGSRKINLEFHLLEVFSISF